MIGQTLGCYRILEKVGAGGMGEVYRARDTKLGRDVALKILPEAFANDPERMGRFSREAQLLAALNHPNIASVYGLEESGATRALVMELVDGPTLADRLRLGAIPLEEALPIAKQVAEGFEAAHGQGIVHRDLKPSNVKIKPDGRVKVLDFGLAKALEGDLAGIDSSHSPTLTALATRGGFLLGTAAYMSPEQARGKRVDKRADIWSFGCVLYEMLTRKQAFAGDTITDTLAAVVRACPDWEALPAEVPGTIRKMLRRCLEKDPSQRLHDIADARIEIEEAMRGPWETAEAPAEIARPAVFQRVLPWTMAGLLAVVALFALLKLWRSAPAAPQPPARLLIDVPTTARLDVAADPGLALSLDGTRLVYVGRFEGNTRLLFRPLDRFEAVPIPETEGASAPFFSPDSQWVGFFAGGKLKKVPAAGGPALTICDATDPRGGSWSPDGTIYFTSDWRGGLSRVSAAGGKAEVVTTPDHAKGEFSHNWPQVLPGGRALLFVISTGGSYDEARIAVLSLRTGQWKTLIEGGSSPHYVNSGHLLYARSGSLLAVPFDPDQLSVTGSAAPVLEGVVTSAFSGAALFSLSNSGSLVYVPSGSLLEERTLVWVARDGAAQPISSLRRPYEDLSLSPDGQKIALTIEGPTWNVWIYDVARATFSRLSFEGDNRDPLWTADGKRVVYSSFRGGRFSLLWVAADGSGGEEQLTSDVNLPWANSFSPDGQLLAVVRQGPGAGHGLWQLPLVGERKARPLLQSQSQYSEWRAAFSPDGHWLAYVSDESGRYEIYVQPFPGPGGKWQISTEGGTNPVWSKSGEELFYRNGDKMMSVPIATRPSFSPGTPKVLFEGNYFSSGHDYAVTPDGKHFVMIKPSEQQLARTQINVVLNWFEELKRLVPGGKIP